MQFFFSCIGEAIYWWFKCKQLIKCFIHVKYAGIPRQLHLLQLLKDTRALTNKWQKIMAIILCMVLIILFQVTVYSLCLVHVKNAGIPRQLHLYQLLKDTRLLIDKWVFNVFINWNFVQNNPVNGSHDTLASSCSFIHWNGS